MLAVASLRDRELQVTALIRHVSNAQVHSTQVHRNIAKRLKSTSMVYFARSLTARSGVGVSALSLTSSTTTLDCPIAM